MNTKLSNVIKTTKGFMVKHSPEILTGVGLAGMITTTVMAVGATPKALILIEEKKEELLEKAKISSPEEANWDVLPLTTIIISEE